MHLRAPRRRDPAARPDPVVVPAAAHDHPRWRGDRARHRVDQLPQRLPARVGAGDGRASPAPARWSRPGPARPLRHVPQLLRLARLRHPAADRARAGPRPGRGCGTCASTTRACSPRPSPTIVDSGEYDGQRVDGIDGVAFAPGEYYLTLATWADERRRRGRREPERLHRPADLLPLAPAARDRPAHDVRLPVALGHRLVLVLAARSASSTPSSAGCGRAAGAARTSTTSWSASTGASASPTGSTAGPGGPSASG